MGPIETPSSSPTLEEEEEEEEEGEPTEFETEGGDDTQGRKCAEIGDAVYIDFKGRIISTDDSLSEHLFSGTFNPADSQNIFTLSNNCL